MCRSYGHEMRSARRVHAERESAGHLYDSPRREASNLRVSDAERNRVIEELQRHTADGRLTLDEFEARVEETLKARTAAELRVVLRELPPPGYERNHRAPTTRPAAPSWLAPAIAVAVFLAIIVLAVGAFVIWLLVIVGFLCFRRRRWSSSHWHPYNAPRHPQREDVTIV
jgi:hypothetical protein